MLKPDSALDKDRRSAKYGRPTFQHRHFATIADIIKRRFTDLPQFSIGGPVVGKEIAEVFASELGRTNAKFDRARFMRACGFAE